MYFITALTYIIGMDTKIDKEKLEKYDNRCFGYFSSHEEAVRAVLENRHDMEEHMYNFLVIEKIEEGIHPLSSQKNWFAFDRNEQCWKEIEQPKESHHLCNYALG